MSHPRGQGAFVRVAASLGVALLLACAHGAPPPETVRRVDLDRYLGTWYEISSFPMIFQRGCVATQATYSRGDDGRIRVVNECHDGALDGEIRRVEGVAEPVPGSEGSKLRVQFFWPFWGDYWVIALDPEYRWALVGHPERKYLWVLSRSRQMDGSVYGGLVATAREQGFDVSRLERTEQPTTE